MFLHIASNVGVEYSKSSMVFLTIAYLLGYLPLFYKVFLRLILSVIVHLEAIFHGVVSNNAMTMIVCGCY